MSGKKSFGSAVATPSRVDDTQRYLSLSVDEALRLAASIQSASVSVMSDCNRNSESEVKLWFKWTDDRCLATVYRSDDFSWG